MKITGLAVQGIGPYEEKAIFRIKPGISVIYGLNHTSGKQSKNSNWVGKSLLFSTISEVLYEQPIVGSKQDRITKGLQQITFEDNQNNKYLISKKNNKYLIKKNGKDVKFITNKKGPRELIEQIWPLTIEEYETFVHIDTRVPHPLVMGSTSIRKEFFTKFFGLDKVDAERKLYLAELNKLASVKEAYNTLYSTYNLIKKDALSKDAIAALEKLVKDLHDRQNAMKAEMLAMQEKQQLIEFANSWKDGIKTLKKEGITTQEKIISTRDYWSDTITQLNHQLKEAEKYKQYLLANNAYLTAYNKLSDKEKAVPFAKAKEGHNRYIEASNSCEDYAYDVNKYKKLIENKVENPGELVVDIDAIKEQYAVVKHQLEHAKKFKNGICPTCGQEVKNLDIAALEAEYYALQKQIAKYNEYQEKYSKYLEYEKNINKYNEALSKLEEAQKLFRKYTKYEKLYRKLVYLPEKPEEYTGLIVNADEVNQKLEHAKKEESFYKFFATFANKIEAYFALDDYRVDKSIFEQYTTLSNKYYELNTRLENARATHQKLECIKEKLDGMKTQLEDVKPLEYLVELFQDKTLKKKIVQTIGNRLMQLVNKYAALIFNEDYHFELEWQASQINIICKRKAGKRELISDVRKLSGAESRLFTLILVLSLMSFIPTAKRPNLLILDEPEANFSAETTAQFYKLIQIIEQAIESIIIITTKTDDVYAGSRCYTIVRDGDSRIIAGHPSELIAAE